MLDCIILHQQDATIEEMLHTLKVTLQIEAEKTCSGRAEPCGMLLRCQIFVLAELRHCECLAAGHSFVVLRKHKIAKKEDV